MVVWSSSAMLKFGWTELGNTCQIGTSSLQGGLDWPFFPLLFLQQPRRFASGTAPRVLTYPRDEARRLVCLTSGTQDDDGSGTCSSHYVLHRDRCHDSRGNNRIRKIAVTLDSHATSDRERAGRKKVKRETANPKVGTFNALAFRVDNH